MWNRKLDTLYFKSLIYSSRVLIRKSIEYILIYRWNVLRPTLEKLQVYFKSNLRNHVKSREISVQIITDIKILSIPPSSSLSLQALSAT